MPKNNKSIPKDKYLSASRIKTYETCSWIYWAKYHLHIPDTSNDGARRGTICHLILELLLKDRHKKHYDSIKEASSIQAAPCVDRVLIKYLKKHDMFNDENYNMCDEMLVVALNNDYFGQDTDIFGADGYIEKPEQEFEIQSRKPKYKMRGFIDKAIQYKEKGVVRIVDYKSSKQKFRGEELHSNVQAMMYSLAAKKLWPKLKPVVEFLFLRFPRQPLQRLEFNKDQLSGFETWLEQLFNIINNFTEKDAKENYAADNKSRWLCGPAKSGWECPLKKKTEYYALQNSKGRVLKTSLEEGSLTPSKRGEKVVKKQYEGCPRFEFQNSQSGVNDPFKF